MTTQKWVFSQHFLEDRADRIELIGCKIGFGEVVKVAVTKNGECLEHLTDTGIIFITPKVRTDFIVTMYVASTIERVRMIYGGEPVPKYIRDTVKRNIKRGWV